MLRLLVCLFGVLWCAEGQNMDSQYSVVADQMSQLLRIREQINMNFSPFKDAPAKMAHMKHEVRSLGDGSSDAAPVADEHTNTAALLRLDRVIDQFAQQVPQASDLGESQASTKHVDSNALNQLLDASQDDGTGVVDRLVQFLSKSKDQGLLLTREQLDSVRQFYIDETANTLARYGYEDSPYGQHDVSVRRGDAVAARKHMDLQDELMHTESNQAGPTDANMKQVLKNLKETYLLSDFLDKLTADSRTMEQLNEKEKEPKDKKLRGHSDPEMSQLAALQSDEESITNGIEKLLHSIQKGNSMTMASALHAGADATTPHGSLEDRATTEATRLAQLEKELHQQDHKDSSEDAHTETDAPTVRVPLPKLRHQLSGLISTELDHTLMKFKTMRDAGDTVDPELKAKIESYMSQITAHLLHTCVNYELWDQPAAITDETKAADSGDPDELSKLHRGTHLSSSNVVKNFLTDALAVHKGQTAVPWSLKKLMRPGAYLPGVGKLVVTNVHP